MKRVICILLSVFLVLAPVSVHAGQEDAKVQSASTTGFQISVSSTYREESPADTADTPVTEYSQQEIIENWNPASPAMQSIVEFVTESVDEDSDGYIPKADRVAVFDMDGTLYGERFPTYFNDWLFIWRALYDDSYEAPAYLKAFAQSWEDKVLKGIPIEDFDALERELGPKLYEGLTPQAYAEVVSKFKEQSVWGFEGMTYGEAYFQPMVSLVKYLYEHDYTIYIVSATYRDAVRIMTEGVLDEYIPSDHVIGTDLLYVASGDGNEESMFYELEAEDTLQIAGSLFQKNQKTNKAVVIQREIGKVPVLAFGNSTGDFSMATYTLQNERYPARAYMLLCDDTQRDYGDPETAASFQEKCDARGFYTVSMRDEFATLYPDGVRMTGNIPETMTTDSAGNALGTINNIIVKNDTAVEAIFFGDDKQLHVDEDGTEKMIDTIWVYYDDMTFEQFVELDDGIVLYSLGTYRFEDGGDFIYASSDEDHGDIVINRTQKYKAGEGLVPYESSHTYDLSTLGFFQLVVIE